MNGPKPENERRQTEAAKMAQLVRDLADSQYAVTQALTAEIEARFDAVYLLITANALTDPETTASLSFDVTLSLAPGMQRVDVVARVVTPVHEVRGGRGV